MIIRLFHGTSNESARRLLNEGWAPHSAPAGSQCGRTHLLYLTTMAENARWYAEEKGSLSVLEISVPASALVVDPEDGIGSSVQDEIFQAERLGLPACLALARAVGPEAFSLFDAPSVTSHNHSP